jgi:hypothetical protein
VAFYLTVNSYRPADTFTTPAITYTSTKLLQAYGNFTRPDERVAFACNIGHPSDETWLFTDPHCMYFAKHYIFPVLQDIFERRKRKNNVIISQQAYLCNFIQT